LSSAVIPLTSFDCAHILQHQQQKTTERHGIETIGHIDSQSIDCHYGSLRSWRIWAIMGSVQTKDMTADNIAAVFTLATASERKVHATWYESARIAAIAIADATGLELETVVGVIAALSPTNKWERNLVDAENVCRTFVVDPESAATLKVCTYGNNLKKAIKVLECTEVDEIPGILNGRKVTAFFHCIMGNQDVVVVDGHAYSIWVGDRLTMKQVPNIGKKLYKTITDDYIQATHIINARYQLTLKPYQIQSITWNTWKRIHGV